MSRKATNAAASTHATYCLTVWLESTPSMSEMGSKSVTSIEVSSVAYEGRGWEGEEEMVVICGCLRCSCGHRWQASSSAANTSWSSP